MSSKALESKDPSPPRAPGETDNTIDEGDRHLARNKIGRCVVDTYIDDSTRWVHDLTDHPRSPGTICGNLVLEIGYDNPIEQYPRDEFQSVSGTIDFPQGSHVSYFAPSSRQVTVSLTQAWTLKTEVQMIDGQQRRAQWTLNDCRRNATTRLECPFYMLISVRMEKSNIEPLSLVVNNDVTFRSRRAQLHHLLHPGDPSLPLKQRIIPQMDSTLFFRHKTSPDPSVAKQFAQRIHKVYPTPRSAKEDQKLLKDYVDTMNQRCIDQQ